MTRRLTLTVAIVAIVGLAGCIGAITGDEQGPEPATQVPDEANMLVHIDMAVGTDDATTTVVDALYEDSSADDEIGDLEDEFEEDTGLDPTEASEFLAFSLPSDSDDEIGADTDGAVIVYAGWSETDVVDGISAEDDVDYDETEYEGTTLYEPDESDLEEYEEPVYIGVLASGEYVIGDKAAVTASLDVEHSDGEELSGELREGFDNVENGHMTYAADVSEEDMPDADDDLPEDSNASDLYTSSFEDITVVAGSYYTTDDTVGVDTRIHTDTETAAIDIADVTEGAIAMARGMMPAENQELKEELDYYESLRGQLEELEEDESIHEDITSLVAVSIMPAEAIMGNEFRDAGLFFNEFAVLEQAQRYLPSVKRLEKHYPDLYATRADFFEGLKDHRKRNKMLKSYEKKLPFYSMIMEQVTGWDNEGVVCEHCGQVHEPHNEDDAFGEWHAPQEPYIREEPKVGRNEPCPCGSGKKYKKCCGKN